MLANASTVSCQTRHTLSLIAQVLKRLHRERNIETDELITVTSIFVLA